MTSALISNVFDSYASYVFTKRASRAAIMTRAAARLRQRVLSDCLRAWYEQAMAQVGARNRVYASTISRLRNRATAMVWEVHTCTRRHATLVMW